MKIAILTSGILPVPAVQGGAVETLTDHYLAYNERHRLHDITVFSIYHPAVEGVLRQQAGSGAASSAAGSVNHYRHIDMSRPWTRLRKRLYGLLHRNGYYHYSIDFFCHEALKEVARQDFDVIVLENRPGFALQLQGKTSARIVYHLHNDFLNRDTARGEQLYRLATGIVAVSDFIRQRVATCQRNDEKTVTVYNGIDVGAFKYTPAISREQVGCREDDFVMVFSGRLIPEKGILELIEATKRLKSLPRLKLLIIGSSFFDNAKRDDNFTERLKTCAAEIGDRIVFTGYVKHELIPAYLKMADIAVLPSTWEEPFGLTVVEAMAAGLPVITTARGGIPEIVSSDNAIVLPYPSDLADHLNKAIRQLYDHPEQRQRMGRASQQLSELFDKETYARKFFEAVEILTR